MRTKAKSNAPGGNGISAATAYRCGVKSPASDMEALVDAYGIKAFIEFGERIHNDMLRFGDSIHNGYYNVLLNALPLPKIRKKGASRAEQKRMREMSKMERKVNAASSS